MKYNIPIPVKTEHYNPLMNKLSGIIAGRIDENGQYWIKLMLPNLRKYATNVTSLYGY